MSVNKLILALLLLAASAQAQIQNFSNAFVVSSTSSGGGSTSPGGTVTGANQYRSAGGTFAGDDLILDNGSGTITPRLYGVDNNFTASNTEVLYASGTTMDGAHGLSYNNVSNFIFIGTPTGVAVPTPSATVHVSGTVLATGTGTFATVAATQASTTNVSATNIESTNTIRAIQSGSSQTGNLLVSGAEGTVTAHINDVVGNNNRWQQFPMATLSYAMRLTQTGVIQMQTGAGASILTAAASTTSVGIGSGFTSVIIPSSTLHVSGTLLATSWTTLNSPTAPTYPLVVGALTAAAGTAYTCWDSVTNRFTTGLTCAASDLELKTGILALDDSYGLSAVNHLDPVTYFFKDAKYGTERHIGFIAQDVEKILPELVHTGTDGIKSLEYDKMVAVQAKAIQQLSAMNNAQVQVIHDLTARVEALESKVSQK